ncbi:MAG: hypothetical protein US95_C0010G0019 [Candidatus Woesebacteria bacterium GW2011_GWB1_38_5]|uniref:Uncharacterized protein n=3 Tax=Candidatus Woeseibacteriota TaxID=1752722 RepID=A0A0G0KWK0_9BACT|nr:MAG: hypothetical protein US75_C0007G0038 [Candidatus Woesebacteria bacterium GW2011_GWC1_38_13]KKQ75087.1 MAG: hypothetical protein US95_C0010G0019 [Candidatus Woesebacteria bacterium GW2011_GWB1_38_5]KKQ84063.1 MAG: hypothetical protein UT06_C0011G0052 [Candidatus Woesebacteria bacterium GW2011_GWA1_38_8]
MKKKDFNSFYNKKLSDLKKEISQLKSEKRKVILDIGVGREKNLKKAKNIGKKISQISTILKIKEKKELLIVNNKEI